MDATRAAHDEVFRQLERPQFQQLNDDVRALGPRAHIVDLDEATERTPLVVKAGAQRVYVDADADLEALDKQLLDEEHAAIDADRYAPTSDLFKEEAASLASLSVPITLAIVLEILPPIIISMMIGNVSGAAAPQVLAGSSLSDFFQAQLSVNVVNGLGAAVATLCAQSFGARQHTQLWIYAQAGMLACLYCIPPLTVVLLNGAAILRWLGQEPELARVAGTLINIGLASLPFAMVYTVARSALQAQNIAVPFVVASVASYAVTMPLGYYLGYHTSLGYVGIALSTILCSVLKALAVVPILLTNEVFVDAWPGWQWRQAHHHARRLWPIGAGSVLMATFLTAGFNAVTLLCGYLPDTAVVLSANSIASTLLSLAFVPMMGVCAGGTVRVGNALGAGQPRRASAAAAAVVLAMLGISVAGIALSRAYAQAYAEDYTSDAATVATAARLVRYLFPVIPLAACVYAAQSIFQACGHQWLCAKLNFFFLFATGVPLGLLLAMPLHQGAFGLWNGHMTGGACFTVAAAVWLGRLDWDQTAHEARRNAHLHVDREPETEASEASAASSPNHGRRHGFHSTIRRIIKNRT